MATAASDRIDEEQEAASAVSDAAAQKEVQRPKTANGAACSNCQQPLPEKKATVCPHCGYYFSLGICIELDQTWERLAGGPTPETIKAKQDAPSKSQMNLVLEQVPAWGWTLLGCNAAVLLISVFVRLAIPSGFPRTLWCVTQLFAGIAAFLTCHAIAYLISIAEDASMSMLDIILKPIKLWKDVVRELPKRFYLVAVGSCSVTAVFGAIVIIGALNYEVLLDWGIKAPPQRNLMGAILAQAEKVEGEEKSLEEAVGDFAGSAGNIAEDKLAGKVVEKKVRVDCVIIGYTVDPREPDAISSLLIARELHGRLKYVGRLVEGLDENVRDNLHEELAEIPRNAPFIAVPPHIRANWVQPQFFCRVKCVRETPVGSLVDMEFEDLLGSLD